MTHHSLRLTIVGPAAAWTRHPGRASSSYLVEGQGTRVLLDLGHGAFSQLAAYVDPAILDAIFISHLHPDHGIDLVPLRHYLRYGNDDPTEIALHVPADLRRRYDELIGEEGFLRDLPGDDLAPGTRRVGNLDVRIEPVTHAVSSFAFRIGLRNDAAGLVYSGDCAEAADLLALIRPGDTLLSEASFGEHGAVPGAGHINAESAAWVATEGGARRLILTHLLDSANPIATVEIARRSFSGEVLLAEPGLGVEID